MAHIRTKEPAIFMRSETHRFPAGLRLAAIGALTFLIGVGPLSAEPIRIKSYKGKVTVQKIARPGKWVPVKDGTKLEKGDLLKTDNKSKAELRTSDGSRLIVWGNSRLEVRENGSAKIFGLDFGRIKSFVKKLKKDNKFEVRTPLAAASVRGTVFEVGFDEKSKDGYLDVDEGAVELEKEGETVTVPGGSRIDFGADRPLGVPMPKADAGADESKSDAQAAVRREVGLNMSKEDVMAAAAEEMRLAEYQEGKSLIDVNGARVRLEEYIIRNPQEVALADRDKAYKLVVLNDRDDRFDYFYYRGVFNQTLPEDLSVALKDVGGKLGATAPDYHLTAYEMGQSNTVDSILDNGSGGHIVQITYDGTDYVLTDPANPTNTRTVTRDEQSVVDGVTYHKVYDPVSDQFVTMTDEQFVAGDFRPTVYDAATDNFRLIDAGDTYWRTRYNGYTHTLNGAVKQSYVPRATVTNTLAIDLDADFTYAGGTLLAFTETPSGAGFLHNKITIFYGDGTTETYNTYTISDEGDIAPTSAFAGITTGAGYKQELLKWNYEQVTTATEFNGRKIDLVVEPKILIKSGLIK
jgi:hypothetical protein